MENQVLSKLRMKSLLKRIFRKFGIEITRFVPDTYETAFISIKPENCNKGNVLLSYRVEPFLLKPGESISNSHTNYWESLQIARTFLDMGFSVDIIDFRNKTFIPQKDYSFFIAARTNFVRIAKLLNKDCVKIVHLDTSHWLFNNHASYKRALDLLKRKGVTITYTSQRIVESNLAIEYADYATILGNQFTISTYQYANKPIFRIPISTCLVYPYPEDKDYIACRKNFLWFGSGGLVHKGLDLVLDAFAEMPDYHLYVCGPIKEESDFEKAFYKELYQTPNIHTIGWIDISSQEFIEITNKCLALIYPSCAEGQCGSVVTCMHASLIPIISYETGVDVNDFGVILNDCSIDTIKNTIKMISSQPVEKLRQMSYKAWEFARANHTRERFAEEYKKVILSIMNATANSSQAICS